jgi:hypothetical protein
VHPIIICKGVIIKQLKLNPNHLSLSKSVSLKLMISETPYYLQQISGYLRDFLHIIRARLFAKLMDNF